MIQTSQLQLAKHIFPVNQYMVPAAIKSAEALGEMFNFSENEANLLQVAVGEAFLNAIVHYSGNVKSDDVISMDFHLNENKLVVSIRDKGIPFKIERKNKFSTETLETINYPGIGMILIEAFFEDVDFIVHGRDGKEVRLTKTLTYEQVPDELKDMLNTSRANIKRKKVTEVDCRVTKEHELLDVTRMAWRCYGYTQEDFIYNLEVLEKKVKNKKFESFIAVDRESDQMVVHMGLKYHDADTKVPELGMAFADPVYRVGNAVEKLGNYIFKHAEEKGCDGVFGCSVTTHIHSQRQFDSHSAAPCGIMLGIAATEMQTNMPGANKQEKGSIVNNYKVFNKNEKEVYLPNKHKEMVKRIYEWIDIKREFCEPSQFLSGDKTSNCYMVDLPEELNSTFWIFNSFGAQTKEDIKDLNLESKRKNFDTIYAFVPLGLPESGLVVKMLEDIGFSFAGIMPHIHNGDDRIILQKINIYLDLDKIRIYGDKARELFNYVISEKEKIVQKVL